jgi:hypothetical protein
MCRGLPVRGTYFYEHPQNEQPGSRAKQHYKLLIFWRRGSGSNRRIKVLQTSPLPLGYRASGGLSNSALLDCRRSVPQAGFYLERETGVEPATSSLARKHSTTELLPLYRFKYSGHVRYGQRRVTCYRKCDSLPERHRREKSASHSLTDTELAKTLESD